MPLQATSGAASYDAFGGGVAAVPTYIEDIFSTTLYTGNGSTQTITNGIDLAGKGGMVWTGRRTTVNRNTIYDTTRTLGGFPAELRTHLTDAQAASGSISSFNSNGYSLTADIDNTSGASFASWTFREQPKFFDVVTYTGTGTASQTISHNLGSAPGCVIIKRTDSTSNWFVGHNYDANRLLYLNTTAAATTLGWNSWIFDTTTFRTPSISGSPDVNVSGATYVAYLFAHNAGGFGLTGTDNVISCGSFTTGAYLSVTTVTLGYEPQWLLVKSTADENWWLVDNMRGMPVGSVDATLNPNLSAAESLDYDILSPTATGFTTVAGSSLSTSATYIYIAIRRGPMKTPTTGTSVFAPATRTGTGTTATITGVGFPPDVVLSNSRTYAAGYIGQFWDKLRGAGRFLRTPDQAAEGTVANAGLLGQNNYTVSGVRGGQNDNAEPFVDYSFLRAPQFFDEVCYTGTGAAQTLTHNLGVAPELIITKNRTASNVWYTYSQTTGATQYLRLNTTDATATGANVWNNTAPTSTQFTVGSSLSFSSGDGFVAYLFATCPGVSKVGSYTGNGSTQAIACGFTGGARFVLIKRTDSTGDWYTYDTARGMTTLTDPYLLLNSPGPESATLGSVTTTAGGFTVDATILAAINTSGASYIFLAIS
jgi:hypothetical protein